MRKWKKQSQALLLMMMFLLIFAPMSAIAETEENEKVVYVALGDSLAEGLLSDGKSFSIGYVGNIALDLEDRGYEVLTENYGVSGFTSLQVLDQLSSVEELPDADIITLSVGANDILPLVNTIPFDKFDPRFMDPDAVQKIMQDAAVATEQKAVKEKSVVESISTIKNALTDIATEIEVTRTALEDLNEESNDLTEIIDDLTAATENIILLQDHLSEMEQTMRIEEEEKLRTLLEDTSALLTSVSTKIDDIELPEEHINIVTHITNALNSLKETDGLLDNLKENLKEFEEAKIYAEKANELASNAKQFVQTLQTFEDTLAKVGENIGGILSFIRSVNPDANIYVMGYYNALPFLEPIITGPLLGGLNEAIQTPTTHFKATFVPTESFFTGHYNDYLDNQPNIHPNEAGYRALADAFIEKIRADYPTRKVEPPEPEDPNNGDPIEKPDEDEDLSPIKDSNDDKDNTNDKEEQDLTVTVDKKDNQLPKTATNNYNLLLIGVLLSSIGLCIHVINRKNHVI
ncbi:GDSL-type esterase/lipase family protein [Pseudogracilibacillus sp. SE30717A]|uniref:GDSL-type esterase/lipase family protein n=1 Tax=Pseudogracilibacillus sp. SE30717A TaxID=3098293 RepID=UPI00300DDA62